MTNRPVGCTTSSNSSPPDPQELAALRTGLADHPKPLDTGNRVAAAWLSDIGLLEVFRGDPCVREAYRILRSPRLRRPVEVLAIGEHDAGRIRLLCEKFQLGTIDSRGLEMFERVFWDVRSLSFEFLKAFLHRHELGPLYLDALIEGGEKAVTIAAQWSVRFHAPEVRRIPTPTRTEHLRLAGIEVTRPELDAYGVPVSPGRPAAMTDVNEQEIREILQAAVETKTGVPVSDSARGGDSGGL